MKVSKLIAMLQKMNPEQDVVCEYDSGHYLVTGVIERDGITRVGMPGYQYRELHDVIIIERVEYF